MRNLLLLLAMGCSGTQTPGETPPNPHVAPMPSPPRDTGHAVVPPQPVTIVEALEDPEPVPKPKPSVQPQVAFHQEEVEDLKYNLAGLEWWLKDSEHYTEYCKHLAWEQPSLDAYREEPKSYLPAGCVPTIVGEKETRMLIRSEEQGLKVETLPTLIRR